jgi:hypothetical protein
LGIVKCIEDEMENITKKMERIGEAMAKAIKKELGIKSPSQVFMEIAQFMMLGLADGLKDTANVEAAIEDAGVVSIDKMRKTIEKLRDAVDAEVDIQPTIAPVLDLDAFRKDASRINGYLKPDAISANTSRLNASSVADDIRRGNEEDAAFEAVSGDSFAFTQNNYSPTALSSGEIYRQTKNQLSVAKGAIDK